MKEIIEKIKKKGLTELIKLRVEDDELVFKLYVDYILFVNGKVDTTNEKYTRKIVRNVHKNKKKFKEIMTKIYGKKKGIKKFEEKWAEGEVIVYTPIFPNKSYIIKKIKELKKEGKKVIWLD